MTIRAVTRTCTSTRSAWARRWLPWFYHSHVDGLVFPPVFGPLTVGAIIFWPGAVLATVLRQQPIFVIWITVLALFSAYVDVKKSHALVAAYLAGRELGRNEALANLLVAWLRDGADPARLVAPGFLVSEHDPPASDTRPSS